MAKQQKMMTSREAAIELGVSDARIRQLCIEYNADAIPESQRIGTKLGHIWMLTQTDVSKIRNLPRFGKKVAS